MQKPETEISKRGQERPKL